MQKKHILTWFVLTYEMIQEPRKHRSPLRCDSCFVIFFSDRLNSVSHTLCNKPHSSSTANICSMLFLCRCCSYCWYLRKSWKTRPGIQLERWHKTQEEEEEEGGGRSVHICTQLGTRTINTEIPEDEGEFAVVHKKILQFTTNRKQTEQHGLEQNLWAVKDGARMEMDPPADSGFGKKRVSLLFAPHCVFEVGSLGLCGAVIKCWSHCILQ